MWIIYAAGSAFFAGVTSILAKCGIRKTDSTVATAVRTIVILGFSWVIVWIVGSTDQITSIDGKTLLFLVLSGAATGASWLCYFRALQIGDINKVVNCIDQRDSTGSVPCGMRCIGKSGCRRRGYRCRIAEEYSCRLFFLYGNTEEVAKQIAEQTGGDLVQIERSVPYDDVQTEGEDELESNARPEITVDLESIDGYDTIFVGYPKMEYSL